MSAQTYTQAQIDTMRAEYERAVEDLQQRDARRNQQWDTTNRHYAELSLIHI